MNEPTEKQKLFLAVCDYIGEADINEGWWWHDSQRIFSNCNDQFYWGCSDAEAVDSLADLECLKQAVAEVEALDKHEGESGILLWICRQRAMRVQNAAYAYIPPVLWPLFDAAGPHRPAQFGNPYPHWSEMTEEELEKFKHSKP